MTDETLYIAALEKATPAERMAFLDLACDDPAQRQRIVDLLDGHERVDGIYDQTADLPESLARAGIIQAERAGNVQDERAGAILIERYKLLEEIGAGGMGTVWVAEQIQPVRRKVAVKLIKAGMDSKSVQARFEAERQALAVMDHPNIAKVLDGGTSDAGRPFFVMEYVKGVPITTYCDDARLSVADRLALFVPVCQAVQHAHQKGIIHRDLKPSNILICLYDGQPVPKVIDFGIAKAIHYPLTEHTLHTAHGIMLGTPLYMSPEQAEFNNLDVDTRTDVYALGVILYELLTGTTPLERDQLRKVAWDEMLRLIREEEPPRPSTRLSGSGSLPSVAAQRQLEPVRLTKLIRGELDWIVMKCLEKNRSRRYDTANGLARDIQRYLADETVEACPPSKLYRLKKFARQHKAQVVAASAIFLALLAGVIGTSFGLFEANRQAQLVREESVLKDQARIAESLERAKAETAAAQERKAKLEAESNLALAKKWNKTLGSVFESLDPNANYETLGELSQELANNLKNAVKELDEMSVDNPLEIARMQNTLGRSLLGLGDAKSAIRVFEKSTAICKSKLGDDDSETLTSMKGLATAYQFDRQMTNAINLLEFLVEKTQAKMGKDHVTTLSNMNNLATAYLSRRQAPRAIPILEFVLEKRKARLGENHEDTLRTLSNLASAYKEVGRARNAIELYTLILEKRKANQTEDHPSTLITINNLASAYKADGKIQKAIELLELAVAKSKSKLGIDHSSTLRRMNNLAMAFQDDGQIRKAIPIFEIVLELRKAKLTEDHPSTFISMNNLAGAYKDDGQLIKAISLMEITYQKTKARLGEDDISTISYMRNLGLAYAEAGQGEKAASMFVRLVELNRKSIPRNDPRFSAELADLAPTLIKCQQYAIAESMLRECLNIREKSEPDAWETFDTQSLLGISLLAQKKHAEAEPLLLKGYDGMKRLEESLPPFAKSYLPDTTDRLIELYTAMKNDAKVTEWRKERAKYPTIAMPRIK